MYVDDIWLATSFNNREFDVRWMSTQLDQLIQSGNLQPAPLGLQDLGEFQDSIISAGLPILSICVLRPP